MEQDKERELADGVTPHLCDVVMDNRCVRAFFPPLRAFPDALS